MMMKNRWFVLIACFALVLAFEGCPGSTPPGTDAPQTEPKAEASTQEASAEPTTEPTQPEPPAPRDAGPEPPTPDLMPEPQPEPTQEPAVEKDKPEPSAPDVVPEPQPEPIVEMMPEPQPEPTKDIGPLSCQERVTRSSDDVNAVRQNNLSCTANTDCTTVSVSTGCQGACPVPVNQSGKSKVEQAVKQANQTYCATYRSDGCPYVSPRCVATQVFCSEKVCTAMDCTTRRNTANNAVDTAIKANLACSSDADCTLVFKGTQCAGACQAAVNKTGEAAVKAVIADVNATICNNYRQDGCPYASPSCAPVTAKCVQQQCTAQ